MAIRTKGSDYSIVIAGVGGQGIVTVSNIIAECALEQGLDVKTFSDYGMAQRGGAVSAHIRLGPAVETPIVLETDADMLLGFELIETVRNLPYLRKDGVLIADIHPIYPPGSIKPVDTEKLLSILRCKHRNHFLIDGVKLASETGIQTLNMVMLGAACGINSFPIRMKSIKEWISKSFSKEMAERNLYAFKRGYDTIRVLSDDKT